MSDAPYAAISDGPDGGGRADDAAHVAPALTPAPTEVAELAALHHWTHALIANDAHVVDARYQWLLDAWFRFRRHCYYYGAAWSLGLQITLAILVTAACGWRGIDVLFADAELQSGMFWLSLVVQLAQWLVLIGASHTLYFALLYGLTRPRDFVNYLIVMISSFGGVFFASFVNSPTHFNFADSIVAVDFAPGHTSGAIGFMVLFQVPACLRCRIAFPT